MTVVPECRLSIEDSIVRPESRRRFFPVAGPQSRPRRLTTARRADRPPGPPRIHASEVDVGRQFWSRPPTLRVPAMSQGNTNQGHQRVRHTATEFEARIAGSPPGVHAYGLAKRSSPPFVPVGEFPAGSARWPVSANSGTLTAQWPNVGPGNDHQHFLPWGAWWNGPRESPEFRHPNRGTTTP